MSDVVDIWADVEMVEAAVMAEVRHQVWVATGGTDGCAQCKRRTFLQRVEAGHLPCAEELAMSKGAGGVRDGLTTGGLTARLHNALQDPRIGAWRS
jgi:hypothetical protein